MSRKLILSIIEVENGYVIEDGVGRKWVARNPTKLGEVVEYVAVTLVASLAANKQMDDKIPKETCPTCGGDPHSLCFGVKKIRVKDGLPSTNWRKP